MESPDEASVVLRELSKDVRPCEERRCEEHGASDRSEGYPHEPVSNCGIKGSPCDSDTVQSQQPPAAECDCPPPAGDEQGDGGVAIPSDVPAHEGLGEGRHSSIFIDVTSYLASSPDSDVSETDSLVYSVIGTPLPYGGAEGEGDALELRDNEDALDRGEHSDVECDTMSNQDEDDERARQMFLSFEALDALEHEVTDFPDDYDDDGSSNTSMSMLSLHEKKPLQYKSVRYSSPPTYKPNIEIGVKESFTVGDKGKEHKEYLVEVRDLNTESGYVVSRRFSNFVWLHHHLEKLPECFLELPPKTLLNFSKSPKFMSKRLQKLDLYLKEAILDDRVVVHRAWLRFLDRSKTSKDFSSSKALQ